ncbi:autotransporter outer membrane beta-barrel domain-containing protein [Candidatus Tisiphia endosymbiont of Nemotelus nigrinus]|uniref:autotransporter outer membrane beta-barrel domain-containing protein n=1 Tax=Candidatus Tisiphia endosymbiont of Nemotelus nigrinus TaxID=3066263 RepID=UPI00312C73BC
MAKKQKFFKNLLTSVSVASIVASIGGSGSAFGATVDTSAGGPGGAVDLSTIIPAIPPIAVDNWVRFSAADTLTIDAGAVGQIAGIDVANTPGGPTIVNRDFITGPIVGVAGPMHVTINDKELTLNGAADPKDVNKYDKLGNIEFTNAASTLVVHPDGVAGNIVLPGNITTTAPNQGILTFEGAGTVEGTIGTKVDNLAEINIGDGNVELKKDVFTQILKFGGANNKIVTIGSDFTGEVDFGAANGGTLTFNNAANTTFESTIVNGANGTLNVQTNITATNADIGNINTINIGTDDGAGTTTAGILAIQAPAGGVNLLDVTAAGAGANAKINFLDKKSTLKLYIDAAAGADSTITFHQDLLGMLGNGGIVLLEGTNANTLTVQSNDGTRALGTNAAKLDKLQVRGKVTVAGDNTANRLDVSNVNILNITKDAVFTDESATSSQIAEIHIGADGGAGAGKANYILDADYGDFNILKDSAIAFNAADAQLTLRNSSALHDRIITFHESLPGMAGGGGIVSLEANKGGSLSVQSSDGIKTLGAVGARLDELQVRGKVNILGKSDKPQIDFSNVDKLSVINGATFIDRIASSAQVAEIHIGAADAAVPVVAGPATYIIDAKYGSFSILKTKTVGGGNKRIIFDAANAQLTLRNSSTLHDRTITFHESLPGFNDPAHPGGAIDHGGIVSLEGTDAHSLILKSDDGARTLGTDANKLNELQVRGNVTIRGKDNRLDVSNAKVLNVIKGAVFTDESTTSSQVAEIHIGADGGGLPAVAGVGRATYIIDARYNDIDILAPKAGGGGNNRIIFDDADAQLTLRNTSAKRDGTVTFHESLPGFLGAVNGGIVSLEGTDAYSLILKSDNGARTLGTNANTLNELQVRGNVTIRGDNTDPVAVNRNRLDVSNAKVLNVIKGAVFTDESTTSSQIAEIHIGADGGGLPAVAGVGPATYIIDAKYNDFNILNGNTITFKAAGAQLTLRNSGTADKEIIFHESLPGFNDLAHPGGAIDHGGIVSLEGGNTNTHRLILKSDDGTRTLGTGAGGHKIEQLQVHGHVTIRGMDVATAGALGGGAVPDRLDVSNALTLNLAKDALFTDESATSSQIPKIHIGGDAHSQATYVLDAKYGDFNILTAADQFHFAHEDSSLTLQNSGTTDRVITLDNSLDPGVADQGRVILNSTTNKLKIDGGAGKSLGTAHLLAILEFRGNGNLEVVPDIYAKGIFLGAAEVTTNNITADTIEFVKGIKFNANGNIGNVDFHNKAGEIILANNKSIGTVTGANAGTLTFAGNGEAGAINGIATVNFNGAGIVELDEASATNFNIKNVGANISTTGPLNGNVKFEAAGKLTAGADVAGNVNFDSTAGELTFNRAATFSSTIANAANAILNVQTNLIANNAQIGTIKIINIGVPGVAPIDKVLKINASAANVNLLSAANAEINFLHADSRLELYSNVAGKSITFDNNLLGGVAGAGNGGVVSIHGDGRILTLKSAGGNKTLGGPVNKLSTLYVNGQVTVAGGNDALNVANTLVLNITNGAEFIDESGTSAQIAQINIGEVAGPATYVLDAKHGDFHILATNNITFSHADAQLTLRNSNTVQLERIITLDNALDPGTDNKGIVKFDSVVADKTLKIAGKTQSLGTNDHRLNGIIFSGAGKFTIEPRIYTTDIELDVPEIELNDVNSNIKFLRDTKFKASGTITGNVDFNNQSGTLALENNQNITGYVTSSNGVNGTLKFVGSGSVGGVITNLKTLEAGAGDVTLATGDHTIEEIQGNGTQNLTFASGFNLTGDINPNGGDKVGLIFQGSGSITGVVGTNNNPVGNIQVQAYTVAFGDLIHAQEITISGTAEIAANVTATNITGAQGTVRFNNQQDIEVNSAIGIGNVEIAGSNVKANKVVSASSVNFTSSQEATLTLNEQSTISNITTTGNQVHSLALHEDLTIAGNVGTGSNRFKEIELQGDHTVSITNSNLYAAVLTTTNNSGKVIFNSSGSIAYGNLGADKLRLSDVTFDSNSTVKGDVYSKKITINADKTAIFAGIEKRTMAIPGVNVDRAILPRLIEQFTYYTQIDSDNIYANQSSKMKFDNAALVKASINGGQVILAGDVWFKDKVESTAHVTFEPNKYVILENDITFASIEANQAKIIMLPEKGTIAMTGDLTAENLIMDLGTGQLKYAGNAKLKTLELHTFYDTSKMAGGNIEIQKDSKLDISQLDKLKIKVIARSDINKISEDTTYTLISSVNKDGIIGKDKIDIDLNTDAEQNRFVKWSIDHDTLTLRAKDVSKEELGKFKEKLEEKLKENSDGKSDDGSDSLSEQLKLVEMFMHAEQGSDAANCNNHIGNMNEDKVGELFKRLLPGKKASIEQSPMNVISEVMTLTSLAVNNQIAVRIDGQKPIAAIGAGDDDKKMYGVWASPFYGTANQKIQQGVSGYNMKSAGLIVGFDGLVHDNLLLGAAYSLIDTKMSHKNQKNGDKTNGTTNIFSLYGLYQFAGNWFAEAIASYGITKVKNLEGRVISTNLRSVTALDTAVAKYKSISYGGQLLAGYNYQPSEKLTITPTIGVRYTQFKDSGYTETGRSYQNLAVKKRTYNKVEGILGLSTATNIQLDQLLLTPEVHGYVNYDFKGKAPVIDARLDGIDKPLPTKLVKPSRLFFTVGTSLTAKHNMMEYGVAYNAHIAKKYIGHQGSLKLKVNF